MRTKERLTRLVTLSATIVSLSLTGLTCTGQSRTTDHVTARRIGDTLQVENSALDVALQISEKHIRQITIHDRLHDVRYVVDNPFAITLQDGTTLDSATASIMGQPSIRELNPQPNTSRMAERLRGKEIALALETTDPNLQLNLIIVMRDDSRYVRERLSLAARGKDVPITRIQMVDMKLPGAHVAGNVNGSPIVAGNVYAGFEDPLSDSHVAGQRATAWIGRKLPLRKGQTIEYSAVIGIARDGQLRRDFLAYLERERAHPYRTFLHYNSWFDLGYGNNYDATGAVDRIRTFGTELQQKRGVKLDSFLFDDGWDHHASLWRFNSGFPNGFSPLRQAAEQVGAEVGVWLSPWGGYGQAKQERLAFGKQAGYEIVNGGYALSGPRYYTAFRDVCLGMMRQYGVNQFKFDGTGNVNTVFPGSAFDSDFSAAIHLIGELRATNPSVFINLTTGTWPSPFWLMYADSIWRGGDDDNVLGVGPYRERWITYRDAETYRNVVEKGPLYPLNSLMLHGIIFAERHRHLNRDPGGDFRNEVRSYFGTGTQLQELYITPRLLSAANWDDLAEAAKWSRTNAEVLKDTHWIGGDPAKLEIYGWAAWSPRKAILVLRNPSSESQSFQLDLQSTMELPATAAKTYFARSPWRSDIQQSAIQLAASHLHEFQLAPFQVLTLDLTPIPPL